MRTFCILTLARHTVIPDLEATPVAVHHTRSAHVTSVGEVLGAADIISVESEDERRHSRARWPLQGKCTDTCGYQMRGLGVHARSQI
jgi:hypothetical protein